MGVARTLSWDGAEFQSVTAQLLPAQIKVYDSSMEWWERVRNEIQSIFIRSDMNGTPKMFWSQYWSAHQRFTKELSICAKVPFVVKDALAQLNQGHSVVIGLQSMGEVNTLAAMEEIKARLHSGVNTSSSQDEHDIDLPRIISTSAATMTSFIRSHFPVAPQPEDPVKESLAPSEGFINDNEHAYHQQMSILGFYKITNDTFTILYIITNTIMI